MRYVLLLCLWPLLSACNSLSINDLLCYTPLIDVGDGTGTGVIIYSEDREGEGWPQTFALTAAHVVDVPISQHITVYLPICKNPIPASIVAIDIDKDLALIKLYTDEQFKFVQIIPKDKIIYTGERILTVGYPAGEGPVVTEGFLCSKFRNICNLNHYIASANTYYGNSGGPTVLFKNRQLLGIASRAPVPNPYYLISHINFLVPYRTIWKFIEENKLNFLLNSYNTPEEYFTSIGSH